MSSLAEMLQYAQAQSQSKESQNGGGLANFAQHFIEGAGRGYDAGHAEALKTAQENRDDPMMQTPDGKQVPIDVYTKLLDVKNKMLEHDVNANLMAAFNTVAPAVDDANRTKSLSDIATNALNSGPGGTAGLPPTTQAKIAGVVANPGTAAGGTPTEKTLTLENGKPKLTLKYGDAKKSTATQLFAMKNYVEKGDADSAAALSTAFPDGIPDWANKFMATHADLKQKQADVSDQKNQIQQDKMESDYRKSFQTIRGDPSIARAETQRDAAITGYNTIQKAVNEQRDLTKPEYYDVLGQLWKARTGASPTDQALQDLDNKTLKGDVGKALTYFTGTPAGATTKDNMTALQNFIADTGMQADKLHSGYLRNRLKPPSRLDPERAATVDAERGMSFQEGTGYQPKGAGSGTSGKIKVSNGKETLLIDPKDAADAAKDGYNPL